MIIESVWGTVEARLVATRGGRSFYVLLQDNRCLQPLFEWLQNMKIESTKDFQNLVIQKILTKITMENEVNWHFQHSENIPMLRFSNQAPLQGNFEIAVQQFLSTLHRIMYNPEQFIEW